MRYNGRFPLRKEPEYETPQHCKGLTLRHKPHKPAHDNVSSDNTIKKTFVNWNGQVVNYRTAREKALKSEVEVTP